MLRRLEADIDEYKKVEIITGGEHMDMARGKVFLKAAARCFAAFGFNDFEIHARDAWRIVQNERPPSGAG